MFLRVLGYLTNRFLWAVTDADPYAAYNKKLKEKFEGNNKKIIKNFEELSDLEQLDF